MCEAIRFSSIIMTRRTLARSGTPPSTREQLLDPRGSDPRSVEDGEQAVVARVHNVTPCVQVPDSMLFSIPVSGT